MSAQVEHEIVPAIRDWLAATSHVEIPPGLAREEARRRASELLAAIAAGSVVTDQIEVGDDSKDILWAAVEELDEKPLNQSTFEECDRLFQFVAALRVKNDPFAERDEVLHRLARIGWRSTPGGLEAILKARAGIWKQDDEEHHRKVCGTAGQLPAEIEALGWGELHVDRILGLCARLITVSSVRPHLVLSGALLLRTILRRSTCRVGRLDDSQFLIAVANFIVSIAARHRAEWRLAESGYRLATVGFRRCAATVDLDRVSTERLVLRFDRGQFHWVSQVAPDLIKRLVIPRERLKAQYVYASALHDLHRAQDVCRIVEPLLKDPVIRSEPAFHAGALTLLGNALAYLRRDGEAVANFGKARAILARFHYPQQSAHLTGAMGEYLLGQKRPEEAAMLYLAARETYRQVGQTRLLVYMSVLLAEVLIILGRGEQAETELVGVLPLIDTLDLRREGIASLTLLREAIAKRQTDIKTVRALRDQLRRETY